MFLAGVCGVLGRFRESVCIAQYTVSFSFQNTFDWLTITDASTYLNKTHQHSNSNGNRDGMIQSMQRHFITDHEY